MNRQELAKTIDHTLLKPATKKQITELCKQAADNKFASVCVQPCYVKLCAQLLEGSGVAVCTVIGFPMGENTVQTKVFETKNAVKNGATEIDMVISQSLAKGNEFKKIEKEIAAVVKAANGNLVKVILETCNLTDKQIEKACIASANAGARFVKTSTGYGSGGATVEAVKLMYDTVKDRGLLVKASGGIRSYADAQAMLEAGASRLGTSAGIAIAEGAKQ
ncbi:MAG: deoxyribose-phosphate aldolase [Corallococcus sp.]|nr:deoxyribose-phosphate aldolase [Corallococcus sp.]